MVRESTAENLQPEPDKCPEAPKAEEKRSPGDVFAEKYWERIKTENPDPRNAEAVKKDTERIISGQLEEAAKNGKLELSVLDKNFTDLDREKIFAYSEFAARDKKYKIGPFKLDESGTKVSAEISKEGEKIINFSRYREKIFGKKEKISDTFSPDAKPAGAKKATEILGGVLRQVFESNKAKLSGVNISPREFISKLDRKKIFGQKTMNFLGGMGIGAATRYCVKWGTGLMGGPLVGATSGAIAGGTWEGIKAYRGESKKHRELFAKKEEIYRRAEAIGQEKNINLKEKLDKYFDLIKIEEEVGMVEGKNKAYAELRGELGLTSERRRKTTKSAAIGAAFGGLGGFLGGILGNYISGPKEAGAALNHARKTIGKEAFEQIQGQVMDVHSKVYGKSIAAGLASLDMQEFKMSAGSGDGATNIARKFIHDCIAEMRALGDNASFDKSQLIYAEDHLKNLISAEGIHPGDTFSLHGADILSVLEKADGLSELGKADLAKNFVPNVSPDEWTRVFDYKTDFNPNNHFSKALLKEAEQKAAAAISAYDFTEPTGSDVFQKSYDFIKDKAAAKAVEKGKNSFFEDIFTTVGAAFLAEHGHVVEKFINRKTKKKEPVREYRKAEDFSEGDSDLRPEPKPATEYVELKKEDVVEKGDEKLIDHPLSERASDEYLDNFKKPELDERLIDQPLNEKASDEYKETFKERDERLAKDPFYKFLRGEKLDIKPGWVSYIVTGYSGGDWERFDSFEELKSWYKDLSLGMKDKIKEQDRKGKTRAVFLNIYPPLRNYLNKNEDLKNRFNAVVEKNISALFRERMKKVASKKEENFEEIRGSEIGNEVPEPDLNDKYPRINTGESEEETILRVEREEKMRAGDYRSDMVRGLGEEIKAGNITRESVEAERKNLTKGENVEEDQDIEKFSSMSPDELDEEELRLRYDQDKDKANDEKYEKLYEKINFIRNSRKNAA